MATQHIVSGQKDSDLKKIYNLVRRNLKFFIACVVVALIFAFLINRYKTPTYKFSASILIKENTRQQPGDMNDFLNSNLLGVNQNFQNEIWVAKSSPVIEQTINNLDLNVNYFRKKGFKQLDAYRNTPFEVLLLKDHVQPVNIRFKISIKDEHTFTVRAKAKEAVFLNYATSEIVSQQEDWSFEQEASFGTLIETGDLAFVIKQDTAQQWENPGKTEWSFQISDLPTLADRYKRNLEFNIIDKEATVIEIVFKSPSVKKGRDFINELMSVYSDQNLERKNHIANNTIAYIEKQLGEISDSLSLTEDNLQRFRSSNQLLNVNEQASGISEQYLNLQNQLAELTTRKRYYDYVADYLENNNDYSNITVPTSMGIQDPVLNTLITELITAQAQRSALIQNQQEKNPMVQKLTIQIENARKTISENISTVRKTTDISIDEMNKRIRRIEGEISRLPRTQRQLGGIERKYRLNDAIYNYLLEKRAEAKITQASNLPDNMIIEPAKMVGTAPVSPRKQINLVIALMLGILVPFSVILISNTLNNAITDQETIEGLTELPIMGKIPNNRYKTTNVMFEYPKSAIAESFRALRTNLDFHFRGQHRKAILITSSIEGEGKSFSALNLAMSYAQMGRKTLLLDFDLRKPTSYFINNVDPNLGISTYLADKCDFGDILHNSPHEALQYIQSGPIPPNPMELLALGKTQQLIEKLKKDYDCIVMDTTPLAQVSDAYLLMDQADVKIVVARLKYSPKKIFSLIMNDLRQKQVSNTYIILNDNQVDTDQYGYGYGYEAKKKMIDKLRDVYAGKSQS